MSDSPGASRARRGSARAIAVVAAAVTLAYVLPLRRYGLTLEDEGTLLYQIARVARGELPYVDFSTGYTPGYFALNATLWRGAGDVVHMRLALAAVHAATAAGLALVIGRVARPVLALAVPLLYVAFIPVYPGEFCAFNVPYPAWYATVGWLATALAMLAWRDARRRRWLAVASVAAAATLAVKPNAGLFAIAAAVMVLLLTPRRRAATTSPPTDDAPTRSRAARIVWWALWTVVLAGVVVTFGIHLHLVDVVVYLAPVAALLVLVAMRRDVPSADLVSDAVVLLAPFAALTLPWIAFFASALGWVGFVREVLLIGTGSEAIFYVPYPAFTAWGVDVALAAVLVAVTARLVARGAVAARTAAIGLVAGAIAFVAATALVGVMPEGVVPSIVWQLEVAAFALVLVAHAGGIVWLAMRPSVRGGTAAALLVFAVFMHLQLYPRTDFMHLVIAAPLSAAFAAALLERVLGWEERGLATAGRRSRRAPTIVAGLVLAGVIGVGASRGAGILAARPWHTLPFAVAPLAIDASRAGDFDDLARAGTALAAHVPPGAASVGFPALDFLLLVTGARNPGAHGYFFPGRPDHREEAELLDALAAARPAALVAQNARFAVFADAPPYYFLLRRWVRAEYRLATRAGRFDVLGRDGDAASAPSGVPAGGDADAATAGGRAPRTPDDALRAVVADADPARRRDAVVHALDVVTAAGERLEDAVAAASLDLRATVLLVRSIRDARDVRAASYLFTLLDDARPRVGRAVLEAMDWIRTERIARRFLWVEGATEPWPDRERLTGQVRAVLGDPNAPPPARALAACLAGELGAADTAPALGALLADVREPATIAAAAVALTTLAPGGLACRLTPLLDTPSPELRAVVPALVLELADGGETAVDARACVRAVLEGSAPTVAREHAAWIAAALADGSFAPSLRTALAAGGAELRRAAAWALGEIADPAATAALSAAAANDPDELVRRIALTATAKREGRAAAVFRARQPPPVSAASESR